MTETAVSDTADELARQLSKWCLDYGFTIATAESLTGGQLAASLAAAPESGEWYRGGVVAYQSDVKFRVLGVPHGPVVTAETAKVMADCVARLMHADFSVAVTGVGGPGSEEGEPEGTVFMAAGQRGGEAEVSHFVYSGDPLQVLEQTVVEALGALIKRISLAARGT